MPTLTTLDHLVLTVADIDVSVAFYTELLGMTAAPFEVNGALRMSLTYGTQKINLHKAGAEFEPKSQFPTPGSADLCFITQDPLSVWDTQLSDLIIEGPVARTGALGAMTSIYLRDPDGNLIEISKYDR